MLGGNNFTLDSFFRVAVIFQVIFPGGFKQKIFISIRRQMAFFFNYVVLNGYFNLFGKFFIGSQATFSVSFSLMDEVVEEYFPFLTIDMTCPLILHAF